MSHYIHNSPYFPRDMVMTKMPYRASLITCSVRGSPHKKEKCDSCGAYTAVRCQWTIYQELQRSCVPRCYGIHEWQKKVRREKQIDYESYKGKDFS